MKDSISLEREIVSGSWILKVWKFIWTHDPRKRVNAAAKPGNVGAILGRDFYARD